jgi:hypothetical protein
MVPIRKLQFDRSVSKTERIKQLAPLLNKAFDDFDEQIEGTEEFDADVMATIDAAGLLDKNRVVKVQGIAIHPDNRERAMIVPVDSHELLFRMYNDGFSFPRWKAFGCTPPPCQKLMQAWTEANEKLVNDSDQLLPPLQEIEVFAARGSHGSTGMRCLAEGALALPEHLQQLAGNDGKLSASKVIAAKPSFAKPLQEGVPFDLVPGELCMAVPRLMEILSRIGNASNNVYREQSALQHCNRLHRLAIAKETTGPLNAEAWDHIARQACIGVGPHFIKEAKRLCQFVKSWSGGGDGKVFKVLEAYERTLQVKRKIYPSDLAAIAALDLWQCQRFGVMLVKAMLNAPTCDATGHATLFTQTDFTSVQEKGKNAKLAIETCKLVQELETFLKAYSTTMSELQKQKLISTMEVKCVMHVLRKTAANRTSYKSLLHVAEAAYLEAKALEVQLPAWGKLKSLPAPTKQADESVSGAIRELNLDGSISDSILAQKGFVVDKKVARISDPHTPWTLRALHPNQQTVILEEIVEKQSEDDEKSEKSKNKKEEEYKPTTLHVDRSELLKLWQVFVQAPTIFLTDFPDPTTNNDMIIDIVKGAVKQAMVLEFQKSSEQHGVLKTSPSLGVFAGKSFKEGSFKLVCLASSLTVASDPPSGTSAYHCLGSVGDFKVYARPSLALPNKSSSRTPFVAKFWACKESVDQRQANAIVETSSVNIKVGKETYEISIPVICNTKALKHHDEIICLKAKPALEEPPVKAARTSKSGKGKAKGKGKGKGDK